jgi:benzodiazapine receptor
MKPQVVASSVGLPVVAAALGSVATASGTNSRWFKRLAKPPYQPPAAVFPVVWTALYTQTAVASIDAQEAMTAAQARTYRIKLGLNMALNAGWCWSFFKANKLGPSVIVAGALAASTADLARTAGQAKARAGLNLLPYSAWTAFATVLTSGLWRRNR